MYKLRQEKGRVKGPSEFVNRSLIVFSSSQKLNGEKKGPIGTTLVAAITSLTRKLKGSPFLKLSISNLTNVNVGITS